MATRRRRVTVSGAFVAVLAGSVSAPTPVAAHDETPMTADGQSKSDAPPNIVMTVVDDAGWDDIGYHNDDFHTPTLDNLAKEGVKLEGMYTDRQCTPARSQLMTGRYNIHTGMQDNMIYALEPRGLGLQYDTLPQKLSNVGYDTIGMGKWHLGHYQVSEGAGFANRRRPLPSPSPSSSPFVTIYVIAFASAYSVRRRCVLQSALQTYKVVHRRCRDPGRRHG